MRFLATRGSGLLVMVVGGPSPLLAEGPGWVFPRHSWLRALGAVPRHSWLGFTGRGAGGPPFPWGWVGGFPCCVCLWRGACAWYLCLCVFCVFVVSVLVAVRLCLPRVFVCACVCVVCWWSVVVCPRFPRLGLAAGVGVGAAGVCCGWSLATPGEGSECDSPPLLAGVCCRWWWVFLATPG